MTLDGLAPSRRDGKLVIAGAVSEDHATCPLARGRYRLGGSAFNAAATRRAVIGQSKRDA